MRAIRWVAGRAGRCLRSRKAISEIMANVLMLLIVVVISSVLFVWAVTSFGGYGSGQGYFFSNTGLAGPEVLSVERVFFYQEGATYFAKIYVRNIGAVPATVDSVYINSTHYNIIPQTINVKETVVLAGPSGLQLNVPYGNGAIQKITVASQRTVTTVTWVA